MTNEQIYTYAIKLSKLNLDNIKLPIKISFFLQKNIQKIVEAGQEVEQAKFKIVEQFGEYDSNLDQYFIPSDRATIAQSELSDLLNLEQDLNIHMFKLDDFDNVELTYSQLSDIMFMIEE